MPRTPESTLAALHKLALAKGLPTSIVQSQFTVECFLRRLEKSRFSDRFLLKGARLFLLLGAKIHRPTRDLDLLGSGENSTDGISQTFAEILAIEEADGVVFKLENVLNIEANQQYDGVRVKVTAHLGKSKFPLQIDIGFGDAVTPGPSVVSFPSLIGEFRSPSVRVYPVETVIAEKAHCIVRLIMAS